MWFEAARKGEKPPIPDVNVTWDDMDRMNDECYLLDQSRPLTQVLDDFRISYQVVYTTLEGMSEDELFTSHWNGAFYAPPFPLVIHNLHLHFEHHIEPIRTWINSLHVRPAIP